MTAAIFTEEQERGKAGLFVKPIPTAINKGDCLVISICIGDAGRSLLVIHGEPDVVVIVVNDGRSIFTASTSSLQKLLSSGQVKAGCGMERYMVLLTAM